MARLVYQLTHDEHFDYEVWVTFYLEKAAGDRMTTELINKLRTFGDKALFTTNGSKRSLQNHRLKIRFYPPTTLWDILDVIFDHLYDGQRPEMISFADWEAANLAALQNNFPPEPTELVDPRNSDSTDPSL